MKMFPNDQFISILNRYRERIVKPRGWRDCYFGCFQTISQCIGEGKTQKVGWTENWPRVDCRHFINGGLLNTSCGPEKPLKFISRCWAVVGKVSCSFHHDANHPFPSTAVTRDRYAPYLWLIPPLWRGEKEIEITCCTGHNVMITSSPPSPPIRRFDD
jgi:hypothetical protein